MFTGLTRLLTLLPLMAGCRFKDLASLNFTEDTANPFGSSSTSSPVTSTPMDTGDHNAPPWWSPAVGSSWQWQVQGTLDLSFDVAMYSLDLFDTPEATIAQLQSEGRAVICGFSAGTWEKSREDQADFPMEIRGVVVDGRPSERWLDIRDPAALELMEARMDLAVAKGCDGVQLHRVEGYASKNGFGLTAKDQIHYNRALAESAHNKLLSVGLKDALTLINDLEPSFDFAVNASCLVENECPFLRPFLVSNKAVFHVEFVEDEDDGPALLASICDEPSIKQFNTIVKTPTLDAWALPCTTSGT